MSYADKINQAKSQTIKANDVRLMVDKDIRFPKLCVICGATTEDYFEQFIKGADFSNRDYREDFILKFPVCKDCNKKIHIKKGYANNYGKIACFSAILGIIVAFVLYSTTFSVWLSLGVLALLITLPLLKYYSVSKKRINFHDYLKVKLNEQNRSLDLDFYNNFYAQYVKELNLETESVKSEENDIN